MASGSSAYRPETPRPSLASLDFSSLFGSDLFLRFLFSVVPDQRPHWPRRNPPRHRLSESRRLRLSRHEILVCPDFVLVRRKRPSIASRLLAGSNRLPPRCFEPMAPRVASRLLRMFSVFRLC